MLLLLTAVTLKLSSGWEHTTEKPHLNSLSKPKNSRVKGVTVNRTQRGATVGTVLQAELGDCSQSLSP